MVELVLPYVRDLALSRSPLGPRHVNSLSYAGYQRPNILDNPQKIFQALPMTAAPFCVIASVLYSGLPGSYSPVTAKPFLTSDKIVVHNVKMPGWARHREN